MYKEHFGETKVERQKPAIYMFDLIANKLNKVEFGKHLKSTDYPNYPVLDNDSGIVFSSVSNPIKKLGMNFCLNRKNVLCYIKHPMFNDPDHVENYV